MGLIVLKGLEFFGYHGVAPEEAVLGQKFIVDLELEADLSRPAQTDRVEDTVDYLKVYTLVKDMVENKRFNLLEALAKNIGEHVLQSFGAVSSVQICIQKPGAPIPGSFDSVGIRFKCER